MRYWMNFDKTINQLVPYYLGGRKLILYLQALIKPLQMISDEFSEYAKEMKIEASMTSQIMIFEWYLNRKFSKYFLDPSERIVITNGVHLGVPIYHENADIPSSEHMVLYNASENTNTDALYYEDEKTNESKVSFIVSTPHINTELISEEKYEAMVKHYIDRYRIANKTYLLNYQNK